jgi:hypothetical protein
LITTVLAVCRKDKRHYLDGSKLPMRKNTVHGCQYAGTFDVSINPNSTDHMFYWFF